MKKIIALLVMVVAFAYGDDTIFIVPRAPASDNMSATYRRITAETVNADTLKAKVVIIDGKVEAKAPWGLVFIKYFVLVFIHILCVTLGLGIFYSARNEQLTNEDNIYVLVFFVLLSAVIAFWIVERMQ